MTEITHQKNGAHYKQVVSPQRLVQILREQGEELTRPKCFYPGDEWRTGRESCCYCSQADSNSEHQKGCPNERR